MSVQLCVCLCVCAKPEKLVIRNCQCKYMLWRTIEVKYWWYLTLIFDLDHSPWSAINGNVQGLYYPLGSVMTEWLLHCRCAWSEDGRSEVWYRRHICWYTVALQVCLRWRWSVWSVTSTSCLLTLLHCRCAWSEDGRTEVWRRRHVCWHCCTAGVHEVKMVGLKCDVDVMCVETVALQVCMKWRWSVWSVTSTSCVLTLLYCRCTWSEDGRSEVWQQHHVCWHCCTAGVHEVKMVGLKCDVDVMCVDTVALQVCMRWRWSVWSVTLTSCVLIHCCTAGVHEVKMVGLKCDVGVMCVDTVALQVCMRWRWSVWSVTRCRCAWGEDGRSEVWHWRHVCWHCCTAGVHEVKMVGLKCDIDVMCVDTVALQVCMRWRWSVW